MSASPLPPAPGAAGVLVSSSRIVTRLLLSDVRLNTLLFFSISLLLVALCCLLHQLLRRTDFVRHHVAACREGESNANPADQVTLVRIG